MMIRITNDMKTAWYPADVKPVREGVYETRLHKGDAPSIMRFGAAVNGCTKGELSSLNAQFSGVNGAG